MRQHTFTNVILSLLSQDFPELAQEIFEKSELLQYLNIKTRAATSGSKARASFANHYAIYVLVEDYVKKGFHQTGTYAQYEGAQFTALFQRQREFPFGERLQNHALNQRLNEEFRRYFPDSEYVPILRDTRTARYWFNENLLSFNVRDTTINIAQTVLNIIDRYVEARQAGFRQFMADLDKLRTLQRDTQSEAVAYIRSLLQPNVDARIFEIISYAILKAFYADQSVYWGWMADDIHEENLTLYKTGRTNANDGGIDFVMKPLGRFFQVTETTDVKKYFLDIDKIQKFPLTFVVKSNDTVENIRTKLESQARRIYHVERIVERYMACIEEIINIPILIERLESVIHRRGLDQMIEEIMLHSKVEFNLD
jgi:hypothetical protein